MSTKKYCPKCGRHKSRRTGFHKNSARPDGLQSRCKECQRTAVAAVHKADPSKAVARNKRWRETNPDAYQAACKRYKDRTQNTPVGKRTRTLNRHGLTQEQYQVLLDKHDGKCHVCRRTPVRFHVDHCHKTNRIRGLLCPNCNIALGHVRDDIDTLKALIKYLSQ